MAFLYSLSFNRLHKTISYAGAAGTDTYLLDSMAQFSLRMSLRFAAQTSSTSTGLQRLAQSVLQGPA